MATEVANEVGFDWRRDSPWRRLPWTLPGAILFGLLSLWFGAQFMPGEKSSSKPHLAERLTLDARLIEFPPPQKNLQKSRRAPPAPREELEPAPEPPPLKAPASLAAPPAPSAEEWQLAATYTLKNSKRYRNVWGQQVRSMMGTAVEGADQGQVRFRITINPDGTVAQAEELWSTSTKASELARKAIQNMPPLPPTPTGKTLVFEKTISFLPYETGWPPSYKNDCLPDPPTFKNPFVWDGTSTPPTAPAQATVPPDQAGCNPASTASTIEEEDRELKRQMEANRWGR